MVFITSEHCLSFRSILLPAQASPLEISLILQFGDSFLTLTTQLFDGVGGMV